MSASESFDYLFTTWEGGGNVPPFLEAARRLIERGHRVRVMSDACNRPEIEAAGAEPIPYTLAPSRPDKSAASDILRDWEATTPTETVDLLFDRIICGPAGAYARDVLDELERRPADAIVASEMLFGVLMAAEAARVPVAVLTANVSIFPVPGVPPFGPGLLPPRTGEERRLHARIAEEGRLGLDRHLAALNEIRRELGLPALAHVVDQAERVNRTLLGTSEAFDFAPPSLPPAIRYVGPFLQDPRQWIEPWISPWPAGARDPLVLVALSTTYQRQDTTLQRILDALEGMPVRALVTLGPALDPASFRAPGNAILCASAPHSRVLEQAAAVVTHTGHGTAIRALAEGVPLLCMPMGRDQNDNAARITARGAGLKLPPDASPEKIRASLTRLLEEPGFRLAAKELGRKAVAEAAASPLVAELEALAGKRRQERRPVAPTAVACL